MSGVKGMKSKRRKLCGALFPGPGISFEWKQCNKTAGHGWMHRNSDGDIWPIRKTQEGQRTT